MDNGEMILFGPIVDQAALMGIMNKLIRLNLTISSVNEGKKANLNWRKMNNTQTIHRNYDAIGWGALFIWWGITSSSNSSPKAPGRSVSA